MGVNLMADMSPEKHAMPEQPPDVRRRNFDEVALGYTRELAVAEAARCLDCKNKPCEAGCPVNIRIPAFIGAIAGGDFEGAYNIIAEASSLPAVCGRVCPQEVQCEEKCVRGIKGEPVAIGRLERFAADWHLENGAGDATVGGGASKARKVAVVGSGPAGLSCAGALARLGYAVTIFEAFHRAGGVLIYGIPPFRLPRRVVGAEIEGLKALGVEISLNTVIGKTITLDGLFADGYEAVFIGTGAGLPTFPGIPGENLLGVYSANEFLTRVNLMGAGSDGYDTPLFKPERVAVIGGGNVAMDAARTALRLGAREVKIVYRRSMEELPARAEEVHHASEEGIEFVLLTNPVAIHPNEAGYVKAMECVKMELGEPDASGRRRPIPIEGSNFMLETDCVIAALGSSPNPLLASSGEGLEANKHGCLIVDENLATGRKGVYAGGDAVTGAATVIEAMGAGKRAAAAICEYLAGGK